MAEFDKLALRGELRRRPPGAACIIVPVWGKAYVPPFLDYYLPTLLAPGNVPAVAHALPTRFVVLTRSEDAPLIAGHPTWQRLSEVCTAEIRPVDDLVMSSNHSTTITLAYAREVKRLGPAMTETAFFFLTSDYIMADGSLAAVVDRIIAGASGVLAGNFQIDEADVALLYPGPPEEEEPEVDDRKAPKAEPPEPRTLPPVVSIPARELVGFGLRHLHPAAVANTVNFPACHNGNMNRLFWRVDSDTMIGRFYLMHMVAIRPEVTDFEIGSSCDYSFIPEMCPSDNVDVITDSDDYFVLEAQPRGHDADAIRPGRPSLDREAASLSEWTTARHRKNSEATIVYHAGELPGGLAAVKAAADEHIRGLNSRLAQPPQPHRGHRYWLGAIASHRLHTGRRLDAADIATLREISLGAIGIGRHMTRLTAWLCGTPPRMRLWQARFLDYSLALDKLARLPAHGTILFVTNDFTPFLDWMGAVGEGAVTATLDDVLAASSGRDAGVAQRFDVCLAYFRENDIAEAHRPLARLAEAVKPGGTIVVMAVNSRSMRLREFGRIFARNAPRFVDTGMVVTEVDFVGASKLRIFVQRRLERIARAVIRHPVLSGVVALVTTPFLLLASIALNLAERRRIRPGNAPRFCSSVTMVLQVPATVPAKAAGATRSPSAPRGRAAEPVAVVPA